MILEKKFFLHFPQFYIMTREKIVMCKCFEYFDIHKIQLVMIEYVHIQQKKSFGSIPKIRE